MFFKIGVLKISFYPKENTLESFYNKVTGLKEIPGAFL